MTKIHMTTVRMTNARMTRARMAMVAAVAMLALLLAGCSCRGNVMVGSVEISTSDIYSLSYHRFDGSRSQRVELDEGKHTLDVDILSEEGTLNVRIDGDDGETYYTGNDVPTSSFQVAVWGSCTVKLEGDGHKGRFSVRWE